MNTTKKIAVALAVIMVAAMAAPAAMGDNPIYEVSVITGQSTTTFVNDANFGNVMRGSVNTIYNSLTLTNIGDWDAGVKAKCSDNSSAGGDTYGLIGSTDTVGNPVYIGGGNLALGNVANNLVSLLNDGTDAIIDDGTGNTRVPAGGNIAYDARLNVPANQTVDLYYGLVTITFTNAP
jgi:hypothetical protein